MNEIQMMLAGIGAYHILQSLIIKAKSIRGFNMAKKKKKR